MKKITARFLATLLLIFGIIFGTAPVATPVYAEPAPDAVVSETTADPDTNTDTTSDTNTDIDAEPTPSGEANPDTGDSTSTSDADATDTAAPADTETDADAADTADTADAAEADAAANSDTDLCKSQTGGLSWVVCPSSSLLATVTDMIYAAIGDLLVVNPISMQSDSPVYLVWQYIRNFTNIIFIILLLIVIYSQLTGLGLNNYGIKRILPRLVIAVVLVNLSFLICQLAADVSNILGDSLREFFTSIQNEIFDVAAVGEAMANFSLSGLLTAIVGGAAIAGLAISAAGGAGYLFFVLLIILLGALVAVISGLITLAARQALITLLVMISPLAFVAYLLPNTEKWFTKWKDLLFRMLVFYPMFSFLFGASQLVGYTLIIAANGTLGVILGVAVQYLPLFLSWSLMKMSGTVLSAVNSGVRKLASPLQRGAGKWATERAEQSRQYHLANSTMPGARLRRYLDYRQELRSLDTKNSASVREGQAFERARRVASSSTGRDANGNPTWSARPNRYTRNAKRASLYGTRTATAESAYKNTLEAYGRNFLDYDAQRLAGEHATAYEEAMVQTYLTANEAEAGQKWLLDQYLAAIKNRDTDPYQFNRLIKGASGGLGHLGEASIMGQVIIGNANIEERRRREGRVMINKFGIRKTELRGMLFDKHYIDDNGIATDADGKPLENDQYRLLDGCSYEEWPNYIYVNKSTGAHISKASYNQLDNSAKKAYSRVRYMDIYDDDGKPVQRVYSDDAGYMKELIIDDITIGDPINQRYESEIGVNADHDKFGMLRKYHSTISSSLLSTRYKEHNGAFTPMLTAQANMGYISTKGHLNIGELQSLNVATKPGPLLQNDAIFLKNWTNILRTLVDEHPANGQDFSYYFPDEDIMTYRTVNGKYLKGLVESTDANGNPIWKELGYAELRNMSDADVLEARKNYIKHNILYRAASKLVGISNRRLSPNVLENQKPDTLNALIDLCTTLTEIGLNNIDPDVPFSKKVNGSHDKNGQPVDIFASKDPNSLQSIINDAKQTIARMQSGEIPTPTESPKPHRNNTPKISNDVIRQFAEQLSRLAAAEDFQTQSTDITSILLDLDSMIDDRFTDFEAAANFVETLLSRFDPSDARYQDIEQIFTRHRTATPPLNTQESIERKDAMLHEIRDYLDTLGYDD